MINRPQILTVATAITLLFFAEDASIVRHLVVLKKQTGIGYVFTIDTSVFTDSDETAARQYASYCVAQDDDTPVKFRIAEVSG